MVAAARYEREDRPAASPLNKSMTDSPTPHGSTPQQPRSGGDDEVIGRAFRWSLVVVLVLAGLVAGLVIWLRSGGDDRIDHRTEIKIAGQEAVQVSLPIPLVPLTDMTEASGVHFEHVSGAEGEVLFPEFMGAAVVLFDYDNDGDLDIFFTNGQYWSWASKKPPDAKQPTHALYRNDGNWKFVDVTEEAGLKISCYGMGAAAADYDNDGDLDLFVTACNYDAGVGPNRLYRNDGGRFVDVTGQAGVAGAPNDFSSGCGWFDYDRDGDLDLLVLNYIVWTRQINNERLFRYESGLRGNIRPQAFEGASPYLYRNEGNGLFSDVSRSSGIRVIGKHTRKPLGKSLGLCFTDLNGDGWLDVVVANDTDRNFAYLNNKDGTFKEVAEEIGVAYGPKGGARSGMGIDIADFRNNGTMGIAIGNFAGEMTALFVSSYKPQEQPPLRRVRFTDEAIAAGVGAESLKPVKFGTFFFDVDLDGWQDLLSCNGHVDSLIHQAEGNQTYAQPPLLFWNCGQKGDADFVAMKAEHVGQDFFQPIVGRGAAFGDLDGDGDLDVVLTATGGPSRLLRNDQNLGHHFLRFKLVGTHSDRDAIGALIEVKTPSKTMQQRVSPVRSYFGQCESVVTFGLGKETQVDQVRIVWPRGKEQFVKQVKIDELTVIVEEATAKENNGKGEQP